MMVPLRRPRIGGHVIDDYFMEVQRVSDPTTIYSEIPDNDTLGGRLCRARDATGLTAAQLARRLGVRSHTLQAWESDRSQPRANRLSMLAGVLGVSPSWLLHGVGASPNEDEAGNAAAEAMALQLDRLKRLHLETAQVIRQIEGDIARIATNGFAGANPGR